MDAAPRRRDNARVRSSAAPRAARERAMSYRVVFREFSSRGEAEVTRELLVAAGIEATVISDDCGSVDPALQFGRGVFLLVSQDDVQRAELVVEEALDEAAKEPPA